jgi:hypothetical protein
LPEEDEAAERRVMMHRRAWLDGMALVVWSSAVLAQPRELPADVQTLPVNGYDMAYVECGTGVPVVLVHETIVDYR